MISHEEISNIISRDFSGFREIPVTADLRKRGAVWAYKGQIEVNGFKIIFLIGIPKNFPLNKPIFFIHPFDSLGFIPHVEPDGFVCFIQDQNQILDYSNPSGVLTECFQRTIYALEKGAKKENKDDFLEEFETYWSRNRNTGDSTKYYGLIPGRNTPCEIIVGINEGLRVITDNQHDLKSINKKFKLRKPGRVIKGIYIPIKKGLITEPPPYNDFWDLSMIRDVVEKSVDSSELTNLLSGYNNKDEYIILGIPDNKASRQLVGFRARRRNSKLKHPFLEVDTNYTLFPFVIERIDNRAIVPRGGGYSSLEAKNVLIVGCGSLGGCIAADLAKLGLGKLTLCDPETLKRENIHRHVLGLSHFGMPKVEGLKEYIESQIPSINVIPKQMRIETVDISNLKQFDLIIVATGEPTINLYLNDHIRKKSLDAKIIFCWNEPYGIGGHVLYTDSTKSGCYSCLYNEELYNKASFCNYEQPKAFTKTISGCSGLYVPFSFLDSNRTAEIVSRLSINCFRDGSLEPQIISWKGDSSTFLKEGYALSNRYLEFTEYELYENRSKFISESCLVC